METDLPTTNLKTDDPLESIHKKSTDEESTIAKFSIGGDQQLSNIELIKQAELNVEQLELEKAVVLYDEGLQRFPNDTIILD